MTERITSSVTRDAWGAIRITTDALTGRPCHPRLAFAGGAGDRHRIAVCSAPACRMAFPRHRQAAVLQPSGLGDASGLLSGRSPMRRLPSVSLGEPVPGGRRRKSGLPFRDLPFREFDGTGRRESKRGLIPRNRYARWGLVGDDARTATSDTAARAGKKPVFSARKAR